MEKSFWWVWKFMLQSLGGSIFLLPFVAGQVGLVAFSVILIGEVLVTGNSMIIFHDMAQKQDRTDNQKGEESKTRRKGSLSKPTEDHGDDQHKSDSCRTNDDDIGQYMMRTNYFTIVSDFLDRSDSNFWYWVICFVFLLDIVICTSFYFKLFVDIFLEAGWMSNITPTDRPGYYLLIHLMVALLLIGVEDVTEKMERHQSPPEVTPRNITVKRCLVGNLRISQRPLEMGNRKRNRIDMQAVAERLHGYNWKRSCLFFLFLFFIVATVELKVRMSRLIDTPGSNTSSSLCPGILQPTDYVNMDWNFMEKGVMCVSIILLSLMHFAIFLPIC